LSAVLVADVAFVVPCVQAGSLPSAGMLGTEEALPGQAAPAATIPLQVCSLMSP
jgi:hypothetical protein